MIRAVASLPLRRWPGVIRVVVVATVVEVGLHMVPLTQLARFLHVPLAVDGSAAPAGIVSFTDGERTRLDSAARVLRHRPFNGTCLRRALVGGHLLQRRDPALRIGVRKVDSVVTAHAWLEIDGVSLDPDGPELFGMLRPISGAGTS